MKEFIVSSVECPCLQDPNRFKHGSARDVFRFWKKVLANLSDIWVELRRASFPLLPETSTMPRPTVCMRSSLSVMISQ